MSDALDCDQPQCDGEGILVHSDSCVCRTNLRAELEKLLAPEEGGKESRLMMVLDWVMSDGNAWFLQSECKKYLSPSALAALLGPDHDHIFLFDNELMKAMKPIDRLMNCFVYDVYGQGTMKTWRQPFVGNAHDRLWENIAFHFERSLKIYPCDTSLFVIQSAGCGKSRIADEIAKRHFVIPICLLDSYARAYPPPDIEAQSFLSNRLVLKADYRKSCVFLEALFNHLVDILLGPDFESLNYEQTANKFRLLMTEGMKLTEHSIARQTFYAEVVNNAQNLLSDKEGDSPRSSQAQNACKKLLSILSGRGPHSKKGPLLLLAFDGSDLEMTSAFIIFRKCFRDLQGCSIFSIFLSTSDVNIRNSPDVFRTMPVYSDLGCDILLEGELSLDENWTLEHVTSDGFMCLLGRPSFGSLYRLNDPPLQAKLLHHATQQLLDSRHVFPETLKKYKALACLCFRLPIEFIEKASSQHSQEMSQVQDHMRVYSEVDMAKSSSTTTSTSEPFLSEAAYYAMNACSVDVVDVFHELTTKFTISAGCRGQILVALLLTLARDATVGPPVACPEKLGYPESRSFRLHRFLSQHLFHVSGVASEVLKQLVEDFPEARMHFNHYINVHELLCMTRDQLLLFMARGAGAICPPNPFCVDIIHPFLTGSDDGDKLVPSNFGAILIHVTNDSSLGATAKQSMFSKMDPYKLRILNKDANDVDKPAPLIRIIFAIGSSTPGITATRRAPDAAYAAVRYDIWVAGLSRGILRPIRDGKAERMWVGVLDVLDDWHRPFFDGKTVEPNKIRQGTNPGAACEDVYWSNWSRVT